MALQQLNKSEIRELLRRYTSDLKKLEFQVHRVNRTIEELEAQYGQASDPVLGLGGEVVIEESATSARTGSRGKRRGRPRKSATAKTKSSGRKRGRPKKSASAETAEKPKKRRGRPPKKKSAASATTKKRGPGRPPKKKRGPGRPPKKASSSTTATATKRGRKSGSKVKSGYRLNEWDEFMINTLEKNGHAMIHSDFQDEATDWAKKNNLKADEEEIKSRISRTIHKLANKHKRIMKTRYEGRGYAYGLNEWFNPNGSIKKKYQRKSS